MRPQNKNTRRNLAICFLKINCEMQTGRAKKREGGRRRLQLDTLSLAFCPHAIIRGTETHLRSPERVQRWLSWTWFCSNDWKNDNWNAARLKYGPFWQNGEWRRLLNTSISPPLPNEKCRREIGLNFENNLLTNPTWVSVPQGTEKRSNDCNDNLSPQGTWDGEAHRP